MAGVAAVGAVKSHNNLLVSLADFTTMSCTPLAHPLPLLAGEVWVVAGKAVGGFECLPMGKVGGGVYRAEVAPPGADFEALVGVTVGGVEMVLPPGAPGVPWRVAEV